MSQLISPSWAEQTTGNILTETRSGNKIPGSFTFSGSDFTFEDGTKIPAAEIRRIWYNRISAGEIQKGGIIGDRSAEALLLASESAAFNASHPDAQGILLLDDMKYEYRENGTWVLKSRIVALVLKESRKSWADRVIGFVDGRERVKFNHAYAISGDGVITSAKPDEMKITKPQIPPGTFVTIQLASLRIPGVEVGSIIDVETETETYNPYHKDFFFPIDYFQSSDPIFKSRMDIIIPQKRKLFWEARNFPDNVREPTITEESEKRIYTWESKMIAPIKEEYFMPRGADSMPYIQAALFEGWEKIYDWLSGYWRKNTRPSAELAEKAVELTADISDDDGKVAAIYHWIQKNIRYIIIKGDASTLYGSYPAHEVVQKQFGCCVDKAMVMSAMLNAIKIENGPLLINTGSHQLSSKIPNLSITHSISRISRNDGSKYYLDATGYDFRYPTMPESNYGHAVLDPFDRSYDIIPLPDPKLNMIETNATMTLDQSGKIEVSTLCSFTGSMEAGYRGYFKSIKPAEQSNYIRRLINSYSSGASLASFTFQNINDISLPFSFSYEYEIPDYVRKIADLGIMPIPGLLDHISFAETALSERVHPIKYDGTEAVFCHGMLNLPKEWQIRSLPKSLSIRNEWMTFTGEFKILGPKTVSFRVEYMRNANFIPVKEFTRYKADAEKIKKFGEERIFIIESVKEAAR